MYYGNIVKEDETMRPRSAVEKTRLQRLAPISAKCPHVLHGGDYNPDQWIQTPEVWDEDMRLMRLAGCNAMTVGIFSWASIAKTPSLTWVLHSIMTD